jgi:hypothetical protein
MQRTKFSVLYLVHPGLSCLQAQKTQFTFNNVFFLNRDFSEIWKKSVEAERPQMTKRCMCNACWMSKVRNTLSEYVILLFHCKYGCTNMPQCYIT